MASPDSYPFIGWGIIMVQVEVRCMLGVSSTPREPHSLPPPQVVGEQLIYENQLVSDIDVQKGPQGSITRDSVFR